MTKHGPGDQRTCAVPECRKVMRSGMLMCGIHWAEVPKALQAKVYRAYRRLLNAERGAVQEYRAAVAEAVAAVTGEAVAHD